MIMKNVSTILFMGARKWTHGHTWEACILFQLLGNVRNWGCLWSQRVTQYWSARRADMRVWDGSLACLKCWVRSWWHCHLWSQASPSRVVHRNQALAITPKACNPQQALQLWEGKDHNQFAVPRYSNKGKGNKVSLWSWFYLPRKKLGFLKFCIIPLTQEAISIL